MQLHDERASASAEGAPPALELDQANRLVRLAQELADSLEPTRTAELVARGLSEIAGGELVLVYMAVSSDRLGLQAVAGGPESDGLRQVPRLVRRAFDRRTVAAADADELEELSRLGVESAEAIAAPLGPADEPLGVLVLAARPGRRPGVNPTVLETVARLAGAALANGRRLAATFAEARRDPLTELGNHRAFHEHLEGALRRTVAAEGALTLALFDLDDFKEINDREGHPGGDAVLRELARVLTRHCRTREELFRVGGDEFALVVESDVEAGALVVERMIGVVRTRSAARVVTLSAGLAAFSADASTKDDLVHKADLALYAAKRRGKDVAVRFHPDLLGGVAASGAVTPDDDLEGRMDSVQVRTGVLAVLSHVNAAVRDLGRETSVDSMLHAATRQLTTAVGATACVISRLDGETLRDLAVYSPVPWSLDERDVHLLSDYPVTVESLETGEARAHVLTDEGIDPGEASALRRVGMQSVLMVPVTVDGRPWGLAEIYDARARRFRAADIQLAELVIGHVQALLARFEDGAAVESVYRETLASLSNAVEATADGTGRHADEVCELAVAVARRLGLGGESLRAVELGALLHDIGKLRIPRSILDKQGPLSDDEWAVLRTHPVAGEEILATIASLGDVLPVVRSCRERWDGRGYPDRIAADAIPLEARIVAACDAYQSMLEPRPYRPPLARATAIAELVANAGRQLDPSCVEAILEVLAEHERPGPTRLERPGHLREAG
jgi:diguanylate cyclase (GGDEF)-like protein